MKTTAALPFLRWFPMSRSTLKADAVAGLTVALLLVPQSMAYAQLAGLPPHYGLCAALVPTVLAALFGWCPQLHTGPVAMVCLLTASVLGGLGLAAPETSEYVALAVLLSLLVGAILILFGLCRLAALANLLSHAVIVAFTAAGAVIIALSQVGPLVGIPTPSTGYYARDAITALRLLPSAHMATAAFGIGTLASLVAFRACLPKWPGSLIAIAAATLISWLAGFHATMGGSIVGAIPSGLQAPGIPRMDFDTVARLFPSAVVVALIGFLEVLAVCKSVAARTGQRLNLNQELIGQGLANIGGAVFQAFPTSGSFSRSALNLYAGARTGLSSLISALVVLMVLLLFTPALYHVPRASLAAVIIMAVVGLVDIRQLLRIARVSRADAATAGITIVATIALAPRIVEGVLVGAGVAIVIHLYKMMTPHAAVLGRHPDGTLRDAQRHGLPVDERILAVRFDGRLIFANAERFEEFVLDARASHPSAKALLIVAEGINDVDSSGEAVLRRLVEDMRSAGMEVAFARIKGRVEDRLRRSGLFDVIGTENVFPTADAAWRALMGQAAPNPTQPTTGNNSAAFRSTVTRAGGPASRSASANAEDSEDAQA